MTHVGLSIYPANLGGNMSKVANAIFGAIIIVGVLFMLSQTYRFWSNGGLKNMTPYIQFKMTKW